jgi:hypothetical protein
VPDDGISKKTKGADSMTERWFFTRDGDAVVLRSRVEGDDGTVGDAFDEVRPGGKLLNLSYQELFDAHAGVLVIEDEKARIVKAA